MKVDGGLDSRGQSIRPFMAEAKNSSRWRAGEGVGGGKEGVDGAVVTMTTAMIDGRMEEREATWRRACNCLEWQMNSNWWKEEGKTGHNIVRSSFKRPRFPPLPLATGRPPKTLSVALATFALQNLSPLALTTGRPLKPLSVAPRNGSPLTTSKAIYHVTL